MSIKRQHIGYNLKHITIALFIAMGATAFVSCSTSDEPIIEVPIESVAVQFNTSIEKETQTRATTLDDAALKSEGFGVLAYYTQNSAWSAAASTATPNFMHNQKISWSTANSLWNYSPIRYWPNNTNDKVSFFAYAPFETSPTNGATKGIKLSTNTATGTPSINFSINFSINSSITNQVDLVYASSIDKNREVVDFQFKHALSRIGFSAKAASDYGNTKIKVKSVSIKGKFYPTATFTFSNLSNDGSWSNFGTPAATGITYAPELNVNANALGTVAQQISKDNQNIMVIPQNFEGANKLTVVTNYTSVTNGVESPDTKTKSEDINLNFEQGKAYNIVLNISLEQVITPQPEANSYIVAPNGDPLRIPVSRVNNSMLGNQLGAGDVFTAELVWTDNSNKISASSNIKSISVEGTGPTGYLVVEPGSAEGNAVVAIKKGGKILWSWHIWVTKETPTVSGTQGFMDRNLGAIGNTPGTVGAKGLLYQWGRKDPFPGSARINFDNNDATEPTLYTKDGTTTIAKTAVTVNNNFANSVANPATFYHDGNSAPYDWYTNSESGQNNTLWDGGSSKTIYDPCPPGWRVPKNGAWGGLSTSNFTLGNSGRTADSHGGFYPAAGYRHRSSGNFYLVGSNGYYWSATVNGPYVYHLHLSSSGVYPSYSSHRAYGFSVRCVQE